MAVKVETMAKGIKAAAARALASVAQAQAAGNASLASMYRRDAEALASVLAMLKAGDVDAAAKRFALLDACVRQLASPRTHKALVDAWFA